MSKMKQMDGQISLFDIQTEPTPDRKRVGDSGLYYLSDRISDQFKAGTFNRDSLSVDDRRAIAYFGQQEHKADIRHDDIIVFLGEYESPSPCELYINMNNLALFRRWI